MMLLKILFCLLVCFYCVNCKILRRQHRGEKTGPNALVPENQATTGNGGQPDEIPAKNVQTAEIGDYANPDFPAEPVHTAEIGDGDYANPDIPADPVHTAEIGDGNDAKPGDLPAEHVETAEITNGTNNGKPDETQNNANENNGENDNPETDNKPDGSCPLTLNAKKPFGILKSIEGKYRDVISEYERIVGSQQLDEWMLTKILRAQGVAERAIHEAKGDKYAVPSGLNLGGNTMILMDQTAMFFHRLKLRNNTVFRIKSLKNNLTELAVDCKMILGDLHLVGTYERALLKNNAFNYKPSHGTVEFLLRNVKYDVEGRYRLIGNRLYIENVVSSFVIDHTMMLFVFKNGSATRPTIIPSSLLDGFYERLKVDLDLWIKDYFNDLLIYLPFKTPDNAKFRQYDKEKTFALNKYVDESLTQLKQRQRQAQISFASVPTFRIISVTSTKVVAKNGLIYGLNSMYRRSMATVRKQDGNLNIVSVVGFSDLKVVYRYEVDLGLGHELIGMILFSTNELTAKLTMQLTEAPEKAELSFTDLRTLKPESLVIEGPANRFLANLRHIIHTHIVTFVSKAIRTKITKLATLINCKPDFDKLPPSFSGEDVNTAEENNNKPNNTDKPEDIPNESVHTAEIDGKPTNPDEHEDIPQESVHTAEIDGEKPNETEDIPNESVHTAEVDGDNKPDNPADIPDQSVSTAEIDWRSNTTLQKLTDSPPDSRTGEVEDNGEKQQN